MKKTWRILWRTALCVILSILICIAFCGCDELNEMREMHAVYTESGNISWNGNEYIKLQKCNYLQPLNYIMIQVTEPDVPVLLSDMFGDYFFASKDGIFLTDWDRNYCRADKYAEISKRIEEGFVSAGYCYKYHNDPVGGEPKYYRLSKKEEQAVKSVLNTVEGTVLPENVYQEADHTVDLMACSEDLLFKKDTDITINIFEDSCWLEEYRNDQTIMYQVPKSMKSVFEGIMSACITAEEAW